MRLDLYLYEHSFYPSREKARIAIKKGIVEVDGKVIDKPAYEYITGEITITETLLEYVSFGGLKLQRAIEVFNLDFKDKDVLDIGASTGGFTDCSLKYGARSVVAVDVGTSQLAESLRNNPKVESIENMNILDYRTDKHFDHLVMDVSFVSITKIIPGLLKFLDEDNDLVCLFKPQFEVSMKHMKNGVVKDAKIHKEVCLELISFIESLGLYVNNLTYSTQKGKMGNIEYLALVSKNPKCERFDINQIIQKSHEM